MSIPVLNSERVGKARGLAAILGCDTEGTLKRIIRKGNHTEPSVSPK
jgi:hypothetical protein